MRYTIKNCVCKLQTAYRLLLKDQLSMYFKLKTKIEFDCDEAILSSALRQAFAKNLMMLFCARCNDLRTFIIMRK